MLMEQQEEEKYFTSFFLQNSESAVLIIIDRMCYKNTFRDISSRFSKWLFNLFFAFAFQMVDTWNFFPPQIKSTCSTNSFDPLVLSSHEQFCHRVIKVRAIVFALVSSWLLMKAWNVWQVNLEQQHENIKKVFKSIMSMEIDFSWKGEVCFLYRFNSLCWR